MHEKVIYVSVALTIKSANPITEDICQNVVYECDYNFTYKDNGIQIIKTEVVFNKRNFRDLS
jgi:hypothetical protein